MEKEFKNLKAARLKIIKETDKNQSKNIVENFRDVKKQTEKDEEFLKIVNRKINLKIN